MNEPTITCPSCQADIHLTESLAAPLIAATRKQHDAAMAAKDREIAQREAAVKSGQEALDQQKASIEEEVADKVQSERKRIVIEEAEKARRLVSSDLDQKAQELADLQLVLQQRDEKLAEAQKAQAELIRKQRALDDARREMDLTIEKRVQESLGSVREKAKLEAEDGLKLRVAEKEEQIASMQRQIEELRRKAEQGSQQLQGEVLELELEANLRAKFPRDVIEPVPKGEFGGDVVQRVMGAQNQLCGTILWESKRTRIGPMVGLPSCGRISAKPKPTSPLSFQVCCQRASTPSIRSKVSGSLSRGARSQSPSRCAITSLSLPQLDKRARASRPRWSWSTAI